MSTLFHFLILKMEITNGENQPEGYSILMLCSGECMAEHSYVVDYFEPLNEVTVTTVILVDSIYEDEKVGRRVRGLWPERIDVLMVRSFSELLLYMEETPSGAGIRFDRIVSFGFQVSWFAPENTDELYEIRWDAFVLFQNLASKCGELRWLQFPEAGDPSLDFSNHQSVVAGEYLTSLANGFLTGLPVAFVQRKFADF
jgi:hypothetical protein